MRLPKHLLLAWLPLALVATAAIGAAYVLVQQDLRQSGNDPQIMLAEDAARLMADGHEATGIVPPASGLDLSSSLAPFLAVYDDADKPLAWSMTLDGQAPQPPQGVFAYAQAHGEDRVTWQPRPDVRMALIVMSFKKSDGTFGFSASGRSLREVESRESQAEMLAVAAWTATLCACYLACLLARRSQEA